jgi:hypothetical protein
LGCCSAECSHDFPRPETPDNKINQIQNKKKHKSNIKLFFKKRKKKEMR